uniref:ZP domain-containing protein n=1 Tax=Sinocyclocheilus anshuiensis TaxID=1608454 RepID=A0A671S0R4_9TELE
MFAIVIVFVLTESTTSSSDPCHNYNTLDEYWRDIRQNAYQYSGHNDTLVKWSGWYRLYLNGESAQMSEWCVSYVGCGGETGLYLNGSHPTLEDGVVTREVLGSHIRSNQCGGHKSTSIQVKACPGDYYVYKLVKPDVSIPAPMYCAVAFSSISSDPCYNYESLDRPWRATNESGDWICDNAFSWNGWYRLFYYGMNIQMSETCVSPYSCNTDYTQWLNGPHPQIEDGVVIREVCGNYWSDCCDYKMKPIRVKACPGNYYVYELVKPQIWCSGYCTDINTLSQVVSSESLYNITGSSITLNYDPCNNYNILDNHWRSTLNYEFWNGYANELDDTRVEWDGWYRLFIDGSNAQMPEWCMSYMSCGGFSALYLGGSHPQLEDGVVTREVFGSCYYQCSHYRSEPIQVKACPGNYYVYKFTRPALSIPAPVYCAVSFSTTSVDPCYNYTSLDEPWRAIDYSNINMCDYNVEWNGWYRLVYKNLNAKMPESCVNQSMCGTHSSLTLNSPHPQLEDGVVTRQVCLSVRGCCDYTSHPISVKACPGNYYVYEFVKPMSCGAYCLNETSTTGKVPVYHLTCIFIKCIFPQLITLLCPCCIISFILWFSPSEPCAELNCTEDERCGEKDSVYGCLCNENQTRPDSFDFSETCESSSGSMSVSRCQLFETGFPADVLHLNDPSCKGTVRNGRVEFHFDNDEHICGTNLVANGTHFIYSNFILGTPRSEGLISREKILKLSFSCVYPQTQTLSMNVEINPLESVVHKTLPAGEGIYQARMIPYEDDEFTQPFTGKVDAELDQKMNVEVRVEGVDSRQFSLVMETCWATPVNDPVWTSMTVLPYPWWVPEQVKASEASSLCGSLMLILAPLMSVLTLF